jgi:hypothetical protein
MTGGLSLLATGVKNGKSGTEMIPIKNISSVTTKRDGLLNTLVQVITTGNVVDFRVSHAEALVTKEVLTKLMLAPAAPVVVSVAETAPIANIADRIKQLASLRDVGVLTEEEFTAKKNELLARM